MIVCCLKNGNTLGFWKSAKSLRIRDSKVIGQEPPQIFFIQLITFIPIEFENNRTFR